ncbi:von Willebrand factor A domain-containing protein 5A-like isoform X2 [Salarias fasciatus]|uniref:von Willebrand factor A domain-containing protein 5A-like isoform X2 n=1 Tax=Salarias fasciatus TaxID=181472 RepID=UPI0011766E52|nr:von Willebrand factor A domain-containing protein 5A-like isoform X2 [Salarias fasciatus]XP_029964259.1 von Willebrand factor A domain-containing protein 5A-like isoform X2 [Salarias fasciatus]
MMNCCGLLTVQKEPVPLKSIEVELEVRDHVATVVSTLNYQNKEDKPIEAVFVFPLPGDAAVCHFSAKMGQKEIVAEVKEKQEAREEYDDALSSGQQAFLLEESDQSPDVFSMSVGCLPPGESASIRLEYVTELAVQADEGLRFCLPAVLNPRYTPQGSEAPTVQVNSVPASLVPYSLSFSARVSSPRPISKVESSCSLDPLQFLNTDQTQATVKLGAGHKFDRDVEVLIYYKDAHQPTAVVEAGQASAKPGTLMGDPVVMVSLFPEFPQSVMSSVASCGEFVFLMDRSGSMDCNINSSRQQETRIGSARDTLLLLLKSLPMGCYFNIYSFGSSYEHIFPHSVEYSEKTMEEALKVVEKMKADLGGTEILEALQDIYKQPCIPKQPRQLFIFTDGEVDNTKQVLDLVKKNSGSHRCFSFGIGEGASSALINGLAREGGGHAQFITGSDRMQPKVMQSLRFALQPAVEDVSVTWDLPKGTSVMVVSPPITTIFQGQRTLLYGRLTGQSAEAAQGGVTVKYSLSGSPSQTQLLFDLKPKEDTGLTIHRLAARTLIRSLETEDIDNLEKDDYEAKKKKVVELSVQSGVSSAFTAFVAVNRDSGEATHGPLVRRDIPVPMAMGMMSSMAYCCAAVDMDCGPQMMMCSSIGGVQDLCYDEGDYEEPLSGNGCRSIGHYQYFCDDEGDDYEPLSADTRPPLVRREVINQGPKASKPLRAKGCFFPSLLAARPPLVRHEVINQGPKASKPTRAKGGSFASLLAGSVGLDEIEVIPPKQPPRDPFLQLVSLQKASGCWLLDSALAAALGKTCEEVEKSKPALMNNEVWATVLALIWLHGFKSDAKEEWELLSMKAVLWLRAQKASSLSESVEAGKVLLGCSFQKDVLEL